jgi:hypothetical protein
MSARSNPGRKVAGIVFDIESIVDGELVSRLQYPGEGLTAADAILRYKAELLESTGRDFIPYTYHLPISLVVATVAPDYRLLFPCWNLLVFVTGYRYPTGLPRIAEALTSLGIATTWPATSICTSG